MLARGWPVAGPQSRLQTQPRGCEDRCGMFLRIRSCQQRSPLFLGREPYRRGIDGGRRRLEEDGWQRDLHARGAAACQAVSLMLTSWANRFVADTRVRFLAFALVSARAAALATATPKVLTSRVPLDLAGRKTTQKNRHTPKHDASGSFEAAFVGLRIKTIEWLRSLFH